ncbi:ATP-binding protein [Kribbella sp. CA-247076]|uniref:ATP-binding protein n=1 Tax=Kribbella sp. CA-247076 TaxID=3239941 RepID=UPI003D8F6A46
MTDRGSPSGLGAGGGRYQVAAPEAGGTDPQAARRVIERGVRPLASSVDGVRFEFQASLHDLDLQVGGHVVLETGGPGRLGQVLSVRIARVEAADVDPAAPAAFQVRTAQGHGIVLDDGARPFHDAVVRPARSDEIADWLTANRPQRAVLEIGEHLLAPGVPANLDAGGFNRHTFLCGQSGSGKTYSLGLVLERLLVETDLRLVVLDPNSDYVRLAEPRAGLDPAVADRYAAAARGVAVRRAGTAGDRIMLRFAELDPAGQAALLRLDPIADREEYAALSALLDAGERGRPLVGTFEDFFTTDQPGARELGLRAANLGVLDWPIWAREETGSLLAELENGDQRCLVVDLGSLSTPEEQSVVAEAVLSTLWRRRARREPVLVVIDEAHNVCPAAPRDAVTALAAEYATRIAAEGRKFGLYLLLSTQRPQKVQENVVSQCDNLLLMRMNSAADLEFLHAVFSFVPAGLLDRASAFRQGHALVAGKVMPHAGYVRFGARTAEEGGADVPATWAASR